MAALTPIFAHGLCASETNSWWDIAAMMALGASALAYAIGAVRLLNRHVRVRAFEWMSFSVGWIALALALSPPIDAASASSFSMHMVQHELMIVVAAPLLILGRPIVPWLWALPIGSRAAAAIGFQWTVLRRGWQGATSPVVAWAAQGLALWVWHLPALYERAVCNEALHAFEHATFLGTALLFWWGVLQGRYGRIAYGATVLFVFTTMVHTGVLGAIFAFSTSPFYELYAERAGALGIDALADQQLAGLFMWVPAGLALTICALALLMAWIVESERRANV